ncbi:unnamed protein product [Boreogadus saida]
MEDSQGSAEEALYQRITTQGCAEEALYQRITTQGSAEEAPEQRITTQGSACSSESQPRALQKRQGVWGNISPQSYPRGGGLVNLSVVTTTHWHEQLFVVVAKVPDDWLSPGQCVEDPSAANG